MADYAKIHFTGSYSANADYSNPKGKFDQTTTFTPNTFINGTVVASASVGGDNTSHYSITPEMLSDISNVLMKNTSSTASVIASWPSKIYDISNPGGSGFSTTASSKTIADASGGGAFSNVNIGDALYTTTAEDAANKGTHTVVTKADNNTITVSSALADDARDITMTFEHATNCSVKIPPLGMLNIPGNILTRTGDIAHTTWRSEIVFQAIGGTAVVEILVFGS